MPEFGEKLGQILLEQGKISTPKFRLALHQQSLDPCPLGELLVSEKTSLSLQYSKSLGAAAGSKPRGNP
jgi:hypothetical protein